jgi:hypothetical protein
MENPITASMDHKNCEEDHPLVRAAYAVGVGLILVGSVMPYSERWVMCGVALIAVCYLY